MRTAVIYGYWVSAVAVVILWPPAWWVVALLAVIGLALYGVARLPGGHR